MQPQKHEYQNLNILGSIASLIGIIGLFNYFTGWVYRWAYFSFFELDINSIQLPFESFFLVPIQVLLGDLHKIILGIIVIIITFFMIKISLLLINEFRISYDKYPSPLLIAKLRIRLRQLVNKLPSRFYPKNLKKFISNNISLAILIKKLHGFYLFKLLRSFTQIFPQPLRNEIAIVAWVLTALFWFAQYQGHADAFRDAVNETSTRPIVTLVTKKENLAIGRQLGNENELDNLKRIPSLNNFRIVGDVKQFYQIWGKETNLEQPIAWRLLLQTNNWAYLFPALPSPAKPNQRPPLLAINAEQGQVQMLILSRPK
ncbi:hypothetical protein [Mastigocoleus sp. MO_188.B34]|uniref:hypothetical protein n=1 Tax=Mastigocoleus sp. MO_188.B34 TaxID=3036635 RepID=UPI002603EE3F|nr:hypothetical protein [Mastigocoleus sp. MO_188.B34]MDJ0697036.1 hypothetical protein [Mastigocoleus sp. MO_188.B34]